MGAAVGAGGPAPFAAALGSVPDKQNPAGAGFS